MKASQTPKAKVGSLASIREASAKIEALFASIGEGIIVTDGKGRITRINDIALELLGYHKADVLHKRFRDKIVAVYDNDTPINMIDRPIAQAFLTGKSASGQMVYRRKDGTHITVQLTVSPVILAGKPIGSIEVFRDVTTEAQQEKLKSDFIAVASHQLRTPLSYINIYAQMLDNGMAGELNKRQRAFLGNITHSVETMNTLIDTLLNISRIESAGIVANYRATDVVKLLQQVTSEAAPQVIEKKIHLHIAISPSITPISTDSLLVRQICSNIIANALKYTPENGKVDIDLMEKEAELLLKVQDSGLGIPLASQKYIFTKFFRATNVIKEEVSGTGLGLYLAKMLANHLGGELWFESTENKGSTFFFSLPKSAAPQVDSSNKPQITGRE